MMLMSMTLALFLLLPPSTVVADHWPIITSEEYGEKWPFLAPEVILRCYPSGAKYGAVTVTTLSFNVKEYGINGVAKAYGYSSVEPILRNDLFIQGDKMDYSEIVQKGLGLCKK